MERILIVEDEPVVALDIKHILRELGHDVCGIRSNLTDCLLAVEEHDPSLVLMDIHLDGAGDGVTAADEIRVRWRKPVIFLTAFADDKTIQRATRASPFGYLVKPFESQQLSAAIQVARMRVDLDVQLRNENRCWQAALELTDYAMWQWDVDGDRLVLDEKCRELFGLQKSDEINKVDDFLPLFSAIDGLTIQRALREENRFRLQLHALSLPSSLPVELCGHHIQTEMGGAMIIGMARQLVPRSGGRDGLAEKVFSHMVDGVLVVDAGGKIIESNLAIQHRLGYSENELLGAKPMQLFLTEHSGFPGYHLLTEKTNRTWIGNAKCRCKSGESTTVFQRVSLLKLATDESPLFVHTFF